MLELHQVFALRLGLPERAGQANPVCRRVDGGAPPLHWPRIVASFKAMKLWISIRAVNAAMAQTAMIQIPESLRNPGQLPATARFAKRSAPAMPKRVTAAEIAPKTCSIPLTAVPLGEANTPIIRPETRSNMPVVALPAPPCEAEKR